MSSVFEVQEIIDSAIINNEPHYLIKWVGYGHEFDTWEPISQLGNITEYIQYWINKKKTNQSSARKERKKVVYQKIKPFLESGYAKPAKKTAREKYAEEILKKKKTWEKYLEKEEQSGPVQQQPPERRSKRLKKLNEPIIQRQQSPSIEVKKVCPQNEHETKDLPVKIEGQRPRDDFRVVGSVSTAVISRIVKLFIWKGIRCLEVELINGRHCNMKEEEVKRCSPLMLLEFLQGEGLEF